MMACCVFYWVKISSVEVLDKGVGLFPKLRGKWCLAHNPPVPEDSKCHNFMEITSNGFTSEMGAECAAESVPPASRRWSIRFKCEGESEARDIEQVWYVDRDHIMIEYVNPRETTAIYVRRRAANK
jgi:hypothetical protein